MCASTPVNVRLARPADAAFLPDIERSAALAFRALPDLGWTPGAFVDSVEEHLASIARGTLWAAEEGQRIIGFLTASVTGGEMHINELDVHLDCQRRGTGRKLITAAAENARASGLRAVTLTTFLGVPWNEPFYLSLGFQVVSEAGLGARLKAMLDKEASHGLPREKRCAMRMEV
jgi:ribosomal protein S18 acetylase RimI-like enzyme